MSSFRELVGSSQPVLIDFSAEWCVNCKVLEETVLHTEPVMGAIKKAGVVTLYGDFTKQPPELTRMIKALGSDGVPVIAIFPGGIVRALAHAGQAYYQSLAKHGTTEPFRDRMHDFDGLNAVLGTSDMLRTGAKYDPSSGD